MRSAGQGRATVRLVSGMAGAQVISVLLVPLLARLYGPETIGRMAVILGITMVLGVVACGGYQVAIPIPRWRFRASQLFWLSVGSATLVSLGVLGILLAWRALGWRLFGFEAVDTMWWFVPIGTLALGVGAACSRWLARTGSYARVASSHVVNQAGGGLVALGAGWFAPVLGALAAGRLVGLVSYAGIMVAGLASAAERPTFRRTGLPGLLREGCRSRKFLLIDVWAALMNSLSVYGIPVILALFFAESIVGMFSVANRLVSLPVAMVCGAAGLVFQESVSRAVRDGDAAAVVSETARGLATAGVVPFVFVAVAAKPVFDVMLGPEWELGARIAAALAFWQISVFVVSPLTPLFAVLGRQGTYFLWNLGLFAGRVGVLVAGGLAGNFELALGLYVVVGVVLWFMVAGSVFRLAGAPFRAFGATMGRELLWAVPVAGITVGIRVLAADSAWAALAGIAVVGAAYLALRWKHDETLRQAVGELLRKPESKVA